MVDRILWIPFGNGDPKRPNTTRETITEKGGAMKFVPKAMTEDEKGFAEWLKEQGYTEKTIAAYISCARKWQQYKEGE